MKLKRRWLNMTQIRRVLDEMLWWLFWDPWLSRFDLSDVASLQQPEIFPDEYREEMTWGTYRPLNDDIASDDWFVGKMILRIVSTWYDIRSEYSESHPIFLRDYIPSWCSSWSSWMVHFLFRFRSNDVFSRPGIYFGVKGRHEASLLFGLAWASLDGKIFRHEILSFNGKIVQSF